MDLRVCPGICTTSDYQPTISENKDFGVPPFPPPSIATRMRVSFHIARRIFCNANCEPKLLLIIVILSSRFSICFRAVLRVLSAARNKATTGESRNNASRFLLFLRRRTGQRDDCCALSIFRHIGDSSDFMSSRRSGNGTTYICVSRNRWYTSANGASRASWMSWSERYPCEK